MLLALMGPVFAADLEVHADRAVRVQVDARRARRVPGEAGRWALLLEDGTHRVEVRSPWGRLLAEASVDLRGEERVVLRFQEGELREEGRGSSLALIRAARELGRSAARAAEAQARAAEAEAAAAAARARAAEAQAEAARAAEAALAVQSLLLAPGMGEAKIEATLGGRTPDGRSVVGLSGGSGGPALASASFAGLDPALFALRLGGVPVEHQPALGAFVATDLGAAMTEVVVELEGRPALTAPFRLEAGRHVACTILASAEGYEYGCVAGGAALTAADLAAVGLRGVEVGQPVAAIAIDEGALLDLLAGLRGAPWTAEKLERVRFSASKHHFTCDQVVRILGVMSYNDDKLNALRVLRPAILDPQNALRIENSFSFAEHRAQVRALFSGP